MSGLDTLVAKILQDCEGEAEKIRSEAREKAGEVVARAEKAAEAEKEHVLAAANDEAERLAERILQSKRLELRDQALTEKRAVVDKVFAKALEKLNNMDGEAYWEFLRKGLLGADTQGAELVIPKKYTIDMNVLNAHLEKNGKAPVTLYVGERKVDGGFVLIKGGIEINRTFEAVLEYSREDLEIEIVGALSKEPS